MGVSTDAILVFGQDFGEDYEVFPWYDEENGVDIEAWWYEQNGLSNEHLWAEYEAFYEGKPYAPHHERMQEWEALQPEWRAALDEYYAACRAIIADLPVEVVRHCSGDYPMYILAVPGTRQEASRGSAVEIQGLYVEMSSAEKTALFLADRGIEFDPKWLLVSYWG